MDDDATTFIVTFPAADPDALDTALRDCPLDNKMFTACLFAAEEMAYLRAALDCVVSELLPVHDHWSEFDHHEVVAHFLEEARREQ